MLNVNSDDYVNGWWDGYFNAQREAQTEIDRLKAENERLYKMAYLTIPIPKWLRRKS